MEKSLLGMIIWLATTVQVHMGNEIFFNYFVEAYIIINSVNFLIKMFFLTFTLVNSELCPK